MRLRVSFRLTESSFISFLPFSDPIWLLPLPYLPQKNTEAQPTLAPANPSSQACLQATVPSAESQSLLPDTPEHQILLVQPSSSSLPLSEHHSLPTQPSTTSLPSSEHHSLQAHPSSSSLPTSEHLSTRALPSPASSPPSERHSLLTRVARTSSERPTPVKGSFRSIPVIQEEQDDQVMALIGRWLDRF